MSAALTELTVQPIETPYSENQENMESYPFVYWGSETPQEGVTESNGGPDLKESEETFLTDFEIQNFVDSENRHENKLTKISRYLIKKNREKLYEVIESDKQYLKSENIQPPNKIVVDLSTTFIYELAHKRLFPTKISTSVEEGICFTFKKFDFLLYLEIYNDGDFGYLIEDSKKKIVIENNDLKTITGFSTRIEQFYNQNAIS